MSLPMQLRLPELPRSGEYRSAGIEITYFKGRDVLWISGFYDSCVGIEGTELSFSEFCRRLGIDLSRRRPMELI